MNQCIIDIFKDSKKSQKLARGIPKAFEIVDLELPSNPAVGVLREHAITGFFIHLIGEDKIELPTHGNKKGFDIRVCGEPLSIKTITGSGDVKVVWTADNVSVEKEIGGEYKPSCDILLAKIYWNKKRKGIFYIPLSVQEEVHDILGNEGYLKYPKDTNHRGISIQTPAMKKLLEHPATLSIDVHWQKEGIDHKPYLRWEEFWKELK